MPSDVDQTSDPSQEDSRETSTSAVEQDDRLNDDSLRSFVDKFATEEDDPDIKEVEIGSFQPEQDDAEPKDEEGEPEPEETEADTTDSDEEEVEIPAKKPEAEADETEPDDEDDSYPDEGEVKSYPKGSQKRIRQLVAARKRVEAQLAEAQQDAEYKRTIDKLLTDIGTTPEAFDNWVNLGVLVQKNGAAAAPMLRRMADNLDGGSSSSTPAPQQSGGSGLDADLQEMVDNLDMTEEAAEKIQSQRRSSGAPTQQPTPQQAEGAAPRLHRDPTEVGQQAVLAVNAEYEKKYPSEWEKLVPEVQKEMAKYKGSPPTLWGQIARDAAEKVIARHKGSVSPQPDPVFRARSGGRRDSGPDVMTREGFADALLSGKLFGG